MAEKEKPFKTGIIRNEKGQIVPGSGPINPAGRPKGQTMKEFAREFLMSMTPEEKREWLKGLSPEIVWRMSEGNPHNTQDVTSNGEKIQAQPILLPLDNVRSDDSH